MSDDGYYYSSPKRLLLGALGGDQNYCGDGRAPFWSAATMYDTHILLFLVAVTHIVYTTITMTVCLWKVGRCARAAACGAPEMPEPAPSRAGTGPCRGKHSVAGTCRGG